MQPNHDGLEPLEDRIAALERSAVQFEGMLQRAEFMLQVKHLAVQPEHVVKRNLAPRRASVSFNEQSDSVSEIDTSTPPALKSAAAAVETNRYTSSLQKRMSSVRQPVSETQHTHEFKFMSPELSNASPTFASLAPSEIVNAQQEMYIALSDELPLGDSHFGVFFGGVGGQNEVEIGIAKHDAAFKWLLKMSADGSIAVNSDAELSSWDLGRAVDSWMEHGPGDVIRVSVTRQLFDGAEYEDETCAFVTFEDLLSATDASVDMADYSHDQPPVHVDRKELGYLTNEFLFEGHLSVYARLYQAGDAVAMVPPELPPLMKQALQLTRRLRKEMSQLQPLQRDFSSTKMKRNDMAYLIGEEMRVIAAIKAFVKEIDDVMHRAIGAGEFEPLWADPVFRFMLKTVEDGEKSLKEQTLFKDFSDLTATFS